MLFEVVKRIRLGWHAAQESFRITIGLSLNPLSCRVRIYERFSGFPISLKLRVVIFVTWRERSFSLFFSSRIDNCLIMRFIKILFHDYRSSKGLIWFDKAFLPIELIFLSDKINILLINHDTKTYDCKSSHSQVKKFLTRVRNIIVSFCTDKIILWPERFLTDPTDRGGHYVATTGELYCRSNSN